MLVPVTARERLAKARRSLNAWARGPSTPHHDSRDLDYFMTYIERRSVVIVLTAYVALVGVAALVTYVIWGTPQRVPVGICAVAFWPLAWYYYLRHHYRPEFRESDGTGGQEPGEERR